MIKCHIKCQINDKMPHQMPDQWSNATSNARSMIKCHIKCQINDQMPHQMPDQWSNATSNANNQMLDQMPDQCWVYHTNTQKTTLASYQAKNLITKSVFSHTKHLQINNLHISTIVFHFRHILFLHDLLIHLFFPFHMSDHHLAKGLSLSSVHDSGIHSLLIPETRLLYQYSVPGSKHTFSKLRSLPRLFPISPDCLPGFWFLLFSFYALSNDT